MPSSLSRNVGYFGENLFHDVIEVQYRLKNAGFPNLVVDGNCGPKTVAAIRKFQQQFMSLPDGLVEPNGKTLRWLQFGHFSQGTPKLDTVAPPASNSTVVSGVRKNVNELSVSPQGHALLRDYESLRLKPYADSNSHEITAYTKGATIGYGHLITNANEFEIYKNGITEMKANEIYQDDIRRFEMSVKRTLSASLTQNEYDAVIIFSFNIGYGDVKLHKGFLSSEVLKILNGESNTDLDSAWLRWVNTDHHFSKGLFNRRKSELNIFHNGVYAR
ncbi:peptidoglycan-binding protein [Rahnella sp. FC061912-K]|uniref:glycoside hydrolase family protein n=1 Tax=Rahnella rivi TaxID=2816249 RepID=UPI001C272AB7|nr:peptidoglycan-binding protein [Rahnella rivi]MBU9831488.1 peptidoglycan-binding protein [Rahnella rivi]